MSITKRILHLEAWLDDACDDWAQVTDTDFRRFNAAWQAAFGPRVVSGEYTRCGARARAALEELLPEDCYVMSPPPTPRLGALRTCFAYRANQLRPADTSALHPQDAVVAAHELSFSFVFPHHGREYLEFYDGRPA